MRPVDIERYRLTEAQRQERWDRIAELRAVEEDAKAQIKALEAGLGPARTESSRLGYEVETARDLDDPIICEPHGMECIKEPPSAMSANASIHIADGATCYAGSLGRRSDFEPDWLATYREVKANRGAR